MDQNGGQKYTFGRFEIDLAQSLLCHENDPVKLSKKTFELLSFFVTHPNEVIEKETLMRELWGDTAVEESNLTVQVSNLRKILGNGDGSSATIETFPKVGYRLNATVTPVYEHNKVNASDLINEIGSTPLTLLDAGSRDFHAKVFVFRKRLLGLATGALVVLVTVAAALLLSRTPSHLAVKSDSPIAVAVLPFDSRSLPDEFNYLSLGLTDNLRTYISEVPGFRLIEPDSKADKAYSDAADVASSSGARLVLFGKIEYRFGELVVTVKVFDAQSKGLVKEKNFLHNRDDFQDVEGRIIEELLVTSGLPPSLPSGLPMTKSQDAYHNYLKAHELRAKVGNEYLRASLPYYKAAYTADPEFASAYAATAGVYNLLANNGGVDPAVALPLAKAALNRAFALKPDLVDAWIESASIKTHEWDWAGADADYRKAIELTPGSVKAHRRYARFLAIQGNFDRGFLHIALAQRYDPMSIRLRKQETMLLVYARRYDEALKVFSEYNDLEHENLNNFELGWIEALRGKYEKSIAHFERVLSETKADVISCYYGYALAKAGHRERAREILREFRAADSPVSPAVRAFVHIGLGDHNEAIRLLEEAYEKRDAQLIYLRSEGIYDSLRSDQRFRAICEKVGLPVR